MSLIWIIQLLFVPVSAPLAVGVIRKVKARMQNRIGAGIFQPYRDLWKLFHKDEVMSADASWIFRFAPYLIFAVTLVLGAIVPSFTTLLVGGLPSDFLVFVYLVALGTFFLALAGLDVGGAFGGLGSSREMTMAALSEGGLIFALFSATILARTADLLAMPAALAALPFTEFAPLLIAFCAFVIVLLAETARFPFDNPATHLELTMIHEAMILEYSGKRLALLEWAAANKFLIFALLAVNIFFPWGLTSSAAPPEILLALGSVGLKILILCVFVAVLESSIAKLRFFRLPDVLLTAFVLSLVALTIIL